MKKNMIETNNVNEAVKKKGKKGLKEIIAAALVLGIGTTSVFAVANTSESDEREKFEVAENTNGYEDELDTVYDLYSDEIIEEVGEFENALFDIDELVEGDIITEGEATELEEIEDRINDLYEEAFNEEDEEIANQLFEEADKLYDENEDIYDKVYDNIELNSEDIDIQGCADMLVESGILTEEEAKRYVEVETKIMELYELAEAESDIYKAEEFYLEADRLEDDNSDIYNKVYGYIDTAEDFTPELVESGVLTSEEAKQIIEAENKADELFAKAESVTGEESEKLYEEAYAVMDAVDYLYEKAFEE